MKILFVASFFVVISCKQNKESSRQLPEAREDTGLIETRIPPNIESLQKIPEDTYSNERFRNVTVKKLDGGAYDISGEAQIFEASFNWVVEDGHDELKSGYTATSAGAPAWGTFKFTLNVSKNRPNSVLHLILFEASAQDGRRTYELRIMLK